ncbi:hypothetical protein SUGI_0260080 [Cryptomeria japonica]|nr:hypothetical protein SUGI_0260080 [Cryptomeria japonica]
MAGTKHFSVTRISREEGIDEQLGWLFIIEEDYLLPAIKKVIGSRTSSQNHPHDGVLLEILFKNVVQATGLDYKASRYANILLREDLREAVITASVKIKTTPKQRYIVGVFDAEAMAKKGKVEEALKLYRKGLENYNMNVFGNYISLYGDLLSASQLERADVLAEGIITLACWMY